jgi:hypothetical protein
LANELDEVHRLGGDVAAVVVDAPGRNAAMARRWHLTFPIHSDPGGERVLKPLDLWNPHEHGGIGWPALIVTAPDGAEAYRYRSRDFADRPPTDDDLLGALRALDLEPLDPPAAWQPTAEPVEDPGALRVEAFGHYFRGVRSGARALAGRLTDITDQLEALAMSAMATSFLDAWKLRREVAGPMD